jgi:hypothetical protein
MTSTRGRPHCQSLGLCRSLDHCCDLDLTCRSVWGLGGPEFPIGHLGNDYPPAAITYAGNTGGAPGKSANDKTACTDYAAVTAVAATGVQVRPSRAIHQRRDCLTATDGLLRLFFSSHMCGTRRGGLCHVSYMKCTASQISASHNTQALPRPSNTGALLRLGTDARVYAASDIVFQSNTPVGKFPASGQF